MEEPNSNDICRICGGTLGDLKEPIKYHEKYINKYLPVRDHSTNLPMHLCLDCLTMIFRWNKLYERCVELQVKLASRENPKEIGDNMDADCVKKTKVEGLRVLRKHPLKRAFKCEFCAFATETQKLYDAHVVAAHCDLIFCCDICKKYLPRVSLISHMTSHARDKENNQLKTPQHQVVTFNCPKCPRKFTSKSGLNYHISSVHNHSKHFHCTFCSNVFASKRVLLNHFHSVHNGVKFLKCNDCDKRFKTDSTLYAHQSTHVKLAPFKCNECSKSFKFRHHLTTHALQHKPKIKTFECAHCGKKFSAQNNLTKHKKIHDKTMEYECQICGIRVTQKRYLRDHMRRVHFIGTEKAHREKAHGEKAHSEKAQSEKAQSEKDAVKKS